MLIGIERREALKDSTSGCLLLCFFLLQKKRGEVEVYVKLLNFYLADSFFVVSRARKETKIYVDELLYIQAKTERRKKPNLCCWKSLKVILELITSVF